VTAEITVEEKQGLKSENYQACLELGRQVAKLVKHPVEKKEHCA